MRAEQFGSLELSSIDLNMALRKANFSDENKEILWLRLAEDWYFGEIARYVGKKYRGYSYTEGAIRYRVTQLLAQLRVYL